MLKKLSLLVFVVGCGDSSVEVTWNDVPARVDTVTVGGTGGDVVFQGDADTSEVFPLSFSTSDDAFDVHVQASYRGLMIAAGNDEDGEVLLSSSTGLDALRPCDDDSKCATGTCGPKMSFSPSLWSCVTACGGGVDCPGGSTCDVASNICVPGCASDSDCAPRGASDPVMISAWTCQLTQPGHGSCALKH